LFVVDNPEPAITQPIPDWFGNVSRTNLGSAA